ncbi:hypothetical protein LMIY3S_03013 [Labrys miyagiensis]
MADGVVPKAIQATSRLNRPIRMQPIGLSSTMMRPAARRAARTEPMAMPMEKAVVNSVFTVSSPPTTLWASEGVSDSMTMPLSQNQATAMEPTRRRRSSATSLTRP